MIIATCNTMPSDTATYPFQNLSAPKVHLAVGQDGILSHKILPKKQKFNP